MKKLLLALLLVLSVVLIGCDDIPISEDYELQELNKKFDALIEAIGELEIKQGNIIVNTEKNIHIDFNDLEDMYVFIIPQNKFTNIDEWANDVEQYLFYDPTDNNIKELKFVFKEHDLVFAFEDNDLTMSIFFKHGFYYIFVKD